MINLRTTNLYLTISKVIICEKKKQDRKRSIFNKVQKKSREAKKG